MKTTSKRHHVTEEDISLLESLKDKGISTSLLCKITGMSAPTVGRIKQSGYDMTEYKKIIIQTHLRPEQKAVLPVDTTPEPIVFYTKPFEENVLERLEGMEKSLNFILTGLERVYDQTRPAKKPGLKWFSPATNDQK